MSEKVGIIKPEQKKDPRWGMTAEAFNQFMGLVCMGIERMSSRQRTMFRRGGKDYCRTMNAMWPHGKPEDLCKEELRQRTIQEAGKIIIPKGIGDQK